MSSYLWGLILEICIFIKHTSEAQGEGSALER